MTDAPPVLRFARPVAPARVTRFAAEPQQVEIDLARSALVVIDMQNDFLHPDGWFPQAGVEVSALRALAPGISALAAGARQAGVPVIWVNWGVRADRAELSPAILDKASAGGTRPIYADPSVAGRGHILVEGDWGSKLIEELVAEEGDIIVLKHRLSAFHDNELDSILRNRGIETLLFAGINTDRCVFSSLCDASFRGYGCLLVSDASGTVSPAYVSDAVHYLVRQLYGATVLSADLLAAFASAEPAQKR